MTPVNYQILSGTTSWVLGSKWQSADAIGIACLKGTCRFKEHIQTKQLTSCTYSAVQSSSILSLDSDGVTLVFPFSIGVNSLLILGEVQEIPPLEASVLIDVFLNNDRTPTHHQCAVDLFCHQMCPDSVTKAEAEDRRPLVDAVVDYLGNHLESALTLDDLVGEFSYCRSHLCKQFQDTLGVSPMLVLARLRVKKAKQLLAETDLTISQVGHAVSYSTVSSFSHFFKRHTGWSPRDYRENIHWLV